jgi:hypothetical protein
MCTMSEVMDASFAESEGLWFGGENSFWIALTSQL